MKEPEAESCCGRQVDRRINTDPADINNTDGLLLASTCVSMMWNMSAPLPASRLGILISTVEPRSLLGPLFMAWNHIRRRKENGENDEIGREERVANRQNPS